MNFWEHPDYKAASRARFDAYLALLEGASHCPSPLDTEAFNTYQAGTMQALRNDLRAAIDNKKTVMDRLLAEC